MNEAEMLFSITVPGSTANLGPGFDSIGMALSRYLKLSVFRNDEWQFSAETETVGHPSRNGQPHLPSRQTDG
ncbi:Homoserine kinase [Bacillus velezensis]|nr:Homoserine kinase [Bacillus velezensis]